MPRMVKMKVEGSPEVEKVVPVKRKYTSRKKKNNGMVMNEREAAEVLLSVSPKLMPRNAPHKFYMQEKSLARIDLLESLASLASLEHSSQNSFLVMKPRRNSGMIKALDLDCKEFKNSPGSCPSTLSDKHNETYNKDGRIGIYNQEERAVMLEKFRRKRQRRVWKKKIRYGCRKHLADNRKRVKGRFVKVSDAVKGETTPISNTNESKTLEKNGIVNANNFLRPRFYSS